MFDIVEIKKQEQIIEVHVQPTARDGKDFRYDDFTPEQIAELQQPANDAIASIQEVELAVETAEGLRQQAENKRQTDTATAISNAEKATEEAIEAAENVVDGKSVELQTTATHIQWRLVGDVNWINLVALSVITGLDGKEVELQTSGGYIQWRLTGGTWANLVEINSLISAKENSANKQDSLAPDGTGTKFPTVDAVNAGLENERNNPFVPIQMPAFYVYDTAKFRVQSVKPTHKLRGNFTHIKKYNASRSSVANKYFIVKTADDKYSISFYNSGYTTRIIIINNGVTIYDLSQASSLWWPNQTVITQRIVVDYDIEKIILSYGANTFEVSIAGLRAMKNIEFTDIELGINSYNSPCAYSILIQGIPASDVDGTKIYQNLNTPSTSNLVDTVAPKLWISNTNFNFENGKVTVDYPTLSGLSTTGNTYTGHNYRQPGVYSNIMFNINNIYQSQQGILVRYSFDIDVENASVFFKSVTTTIFKRIRLVNRDTFTVIDITTNVDAPFEVPVGKWNMIISTIAKRQYAFGLLLGWAGCNNGATMTIYQEHRIDPVSVVLSAYPRLANFQKAWCPYSKQFTSDLVADFSNDII